MRDQRNNQASQSGPRFSNPNRSLSSMREAARLRGQHRATDPTGLRCCSAPVKASPKPKQRCRAAAESVSEVSAPPKPLTA